MKFFVSKYSFISITCAIFLTVSSTAIADASFGFGVSDGDRQLTWLENDLRVSDDISTQFDNFRQTKEEDVTDIDYEAYLKAFKLYMVFKQKF